MWKSACVGIYKLLKYGGFFVTYVELEKCGGGGVEMLKM